MKRHLLPLLFCTSMIFFFSSCNSSDDTNSTDTTGTDTSNTGTAGTGAATASTGSTSNIDTTTITRMAVRHKVANYEKFLMAYNQHDSLRLANGLHTYVIGRGIEDSNEVMVTLNVDDVAKAKAFAKSPALKAAMQKSGVKGQPIISYATLVWRDTTKVSSDIRSRTNFSVKDFNAWRQTFETQKQIREDNGISDRGFGYDVDNRNKVTLVVSISDTAKARAFWNSDQLKQLRAASGTIGVPQRFVYRVVQRY